ncbi:hypothetical protein [Chitinimonas sp. BJYL2]|uniref:hypothetical protein n=1 Tax=Chitinimonas sp. BJYL2 TaxID=2976696 RepID=UPI0022B435B1|nr:hypothetical protein [Chitinimonas sp. BJYL2]
MAAIQPGWLIALLVLISPVTLAAPRCPISATQLTGSWQHVDGPGHYEEMAFEVEGGTRPFRTWLHARPEIVDASWQLAACKLTLSGGSLASPETYDILRLRGKVLTLRAAGTRALIRYRKL